MASERIQRRIERLLDEADEAVSKSDWALVRDRAQNVIALDPGNQDAHSFLAAAERALGAPISTEADPAASPDLKTVAPQPLDTHPTSFASVRYQVQRFLGEGGKKRVYLAHDTTLDRDVAFALIKTEGLDQEGRSRITREAQAMGRLGDHPHIMPIHDLGQEDSSPGSGQAPQPFMVLPLMAGGDVERLIEKAEEHRMPLERALSRVLDRLLARISPISFST